MLKLNNMKKYTIHILLALILAIQLFDKEDNYLYLQIALLIIIIINGIIIFNSKHKAVIK